MFLLNFKYQVLLPVIIILLLCLYENNALKKTMRKIHLTVNMFLKKITSCCRNQENQVKNEDRPLPTAEEGDLIIAVDTVFAAIGLGNSLRRERMETIIKENIKDIEIMCPDSNSNCEKMAVEVELKQIMTKVWQAEVKEQKEQVMRRNSIKEVDSKKGMNQRSNYGSINVRAHQCTSPSIYVFMNVS
ncbi:uncharacterized protein LOC111049734 [Nilaparvata lugens]|uniref:uncharacterized protein LOC111049734 n=1 Tax=Nilaparvata lugens TaxID=108931 RepID=UPI00193D053B|nr:uncharacterized protein LOC111049734 [Nilaparvata lugens]